MNKTEKKKSVGILLPCYNEEENIAELYRRIVAATNELTHYDFNICFIDNASTDNTVREIQSLAEKDERVKAIINSRNFGHIRSPYYGLLETPGDCVLVLASDLQDPPELFATFLEQWEKGNSVVVGQKISSDESRLFYFLRSLYYLLVKKMSDVNLLEHVTGFGLYDRRVIEVFRSMEDPYPYMRGMITEVGLPYAIVPYHQVTRKRGITKNNFFTLLDMGLLAFTSYTRLPLRLATLGGFVLALLSLCVAFTFLIAKLMFWQQLPAGYAPAVIGIFFLGSIQIFLTGVVGEYVGATLTCVKKRPLVTENCRIGTWPE